MNYEFMMPESLSTLMGIHSPIPDAGLQFWSIVGAREPVLLEVAPTECNPEVAEFTPVGAP